MHRLPQILGAIFALACALAPLAPARGATAVPMTLDALVNGSDIVAYARVAGSRPFWDTATGTIWTATQLAVLDAAKGQVAGSLVVTEPGGVVGDVGHLFPGVPRFALNQEIVVFLYRAPGDRLRVVGLWQGVYGVSVDSATGDRVARPMTAQAETVYQHGHAPTSATSSAPAGTRRLSDLLFWIREKSR
jgi:hypothetical protein